MSKPAIWVYSPGYLNGIGLLAQAAATGATGIIDLGETAPQHWGALNANLEALPKFYPAQASLGFRVAASYLHDLMNMRGFAQQAKPFVILSVPGATAALDCIRKFPQLPIYAEVYSVTELLAIDEYCHRHNLPLAGFVAVSAEAGGRTGQRPAFLLLQELQGKTARPVYIRGGIGLHTAGAVPLTSCAGIVLDDQVLLFPASPLPTTQKEKIARLDGREFERIGGDKGPVFSLIRQPWAKASLAVLDEESRSEGEQKNSNDLAPLFYFGDAAQSIWPLGQMAGLADGYAKKFKSLQRFINAFYHSMETAPAAALEGQALAAHSPLAQAHHTEFPLVQGPMTRVSDSPAFALEVAQAGALPFMALALLRDKTLSDLLTQTSELLGDRSWGVGILGFVPPELREEQIREVLRVRPPFALIAGGRPDHAQLLENEGIATYLHVPTTALLSTFIRQGSKRFIFEGRECGGHVGPFHSFPLWEQMITTLLEEVPAHQSSEYSILFAGGIHDALSAAMVVALSSALTTRGMKTGLLMGTAYLACEEAVQQGAITPAFQQSILDCINTALLVSGPGHANRCVSSPFADEFKNKRQQLLREGRPQEEISETLDGLLLGRLRIASKGLQREEAGQYKRVSDEIVHQEGMFMAGEAASFIRATTTCRALHLTVTEGAQAMLEAAQPAVILPRQEAKPVDIAIVGISVLVPGAQKTDEFWDTLLQKKRHLKEIPAERWDWRLLFDEDRQAPDKIYSRWGGFIDDIPFDPLRYGIPPKSVPNIATSQLLALEGTRWALEDAGMDTALMDRENTSVIFATADSGGFLGSTLMVRSTLPLLSEQGMTEAKGRIAEWTEETFPGILCNVVPGRVANRLDFGGRNYAVDAACASSLVAVDLGVRELASGRSNIVIAGGVDVGQTPFGYLAFSKTGALSPTGDSLPFDKKANGIVISEGSAVVVLKRLEDAGRDGDKIYAVIKGIAGSSDGRAMGLTAPRSQGQQLSLERAYAEAGFGAHTIELYEAHGTGTTVGDNEELETICRTLKEQSVAPRSVALGSLKSLIGHTKMAAGMVSLVKTALSLYYKVLPPHAHITEPLDKVLEPSSPVFFHEEAMPWLKPEEHPRRAGISAFGFGGTNFHAVLEEHTGYDNANKNGGADWPEELLLFAADSSAKLLITIEGLAQQLEAPVEIRVKDLAWSLVRKYGRGEQPCRLSFTAATLDEVRQGLKQAINYLQGKEKTLPQKIAYSANAHAKASQLAFVFSGQGAQYVQMGRQTALYYPEFRANLEKANKLFADDYPKRFSDYIFPAKDFAGTGNQSRDLNDTHVAQPAIGLVSTGLLDIFTKLGIRASFMAGHSFGELTALHAAGVYSREDFLRLAEFRGRLMANAGGGAMAAVMATRAHLEELIKKESWDLVIANHNGPEQVVVSGTAEAVQTAMDKLSMLGMRAVKLPVSAAFHSPLMEVARQPLNDLIASIPLQSPDTPVFSNRTGAPFPAEVEAVREILYDHLLRPVEFMAQVKEMYAAGARIFLELGPGRTLTGMINRILGDEPHVALAVDDSLLPALGRLWCEGLSVDWGQLFRDRDVEVIDLTRLAQTHARRELRSTDWIINGHTVKPVNPAFAAHLPQELLTSASTQKEKIMEPELNQIPATPAQPVAYYNPDPVLAAYAAYQETMRQFLRTQEQVMRAFLGSEASPAESTAPAMPFAMPMPVMPFVPAAPPAGYAPPPTYASVQPPSPTNGQANGHPYTQKIEEKPAASTLTPQITQPTPTALTAATPEAITQVLVTIISERTGYPENMITLDLDLERELGVDSIKRMEIFGKFLTYLPKLKESDLTGKADQYVRIKKFKDLVDALAQELKATKENAIVNQL